MRYIIVNNEIKFTRFVYEPMREGLKQADTIKELIDCYIITKHGLDDDFIMTDFEDVKKYFADTAIVYGAIWIKGEHNEPILKSIARMNKNGVLRKL